MSKPRVVFLVVVGIVFGAASGASAFQRQHSTSVGLTSGLLLGALTAIVVGTITSRGWREFFAPRPVLPGESKIATLRHVSRSLRTGRPVTDRDSAAGLLAWSEFMRRRLVPRWALIAYAVCATLYAMAAFGLFVAAIVGLGPHTLRHIIASCVGAVLAVVLWRRARYRDARRRAAEEAARALLERG